MKKIIVALGFCIAFFLAITSCVTSVPFQAATLAWNNPDWDRNLVNELTENFAKLDEARDDMALFCPKYASLSQDGKIQAFAFLMVAMAKFESGYDPKNYYMEKSGKPSLGLFQLSYSDPYVGCPKSKAEGDLYSPKANISCAVKIMAKKLNQDKVVAFGGYVQYGAKPAKGAASYWAVLREPDSKSRHKLYEIKNLTKLAPGCS
jgi:hypothetical protein